MREKTFIHSCPGRVRDICLSRSDIKTQPVQVLLRLVHKFRLNAT